MVEVVRRSRTISFAEAAREHDEVNPMFRDLLDQEDFRGATVLDVGTGTGRIALIVARYARRAIGIDIDEAAIAAARAEAAARSLPNAVFYEADAETDPWSDWHPEPYDVVTANLFMSEGIVVRAGRALRPGGRFLFCCHHTDHWKETRRGSRWALGERWMAELLRENAFEVDFLGVDTTVVTFEALEQVERFLGDRHRRKWIDDGRWTSLAEAFAAGPKRLTLAYLVGRARRVAAGAGSG